MTKKKIILVLSVLTLVALCTIGYGWYRVNELLTSTAPRKPKNNLQEIHQINWWNYSQESLVIDSFKVKLLDGKMNLFNSQVLVAIYFYGKLLNKSKNEAFVEKFHVSERPLYRDSNQRFDIEIQVTPIVAQKKNRGNDFDDTTNFVVVNERIITSMHWGENNYLFRCGKFVDSLKVVQSK